jgi:hypothetical protein
VLGVDWSTIAIPGAFVAGIAAGAVLALRLGRLILTYLRGDDPSRPTRGTG